MKQLEKTLKAMSNRRRLAIIKFLKETGGATVGEISREIRISFKTTSKHLGILLAADIVDREQKGRAVLYFLAKESKPIVKSLVSLL